MFILLAIMLFLKDLIILFFKNFNHVSIIIQIIHILIEMITFLFN